MKYIPLATILLCAGCAAQPPEIQTQIVKVEVPVPCKVNVGPDPAYSDTDAELSKVPYPNAVMAYVANPADPTALKQMGENMLFIISHYRAGRGERIARDAQKQTAIDSCGKMP